jgi:hypothetical protein
VINQKTVLILGAGASRPYFLPTGAELRNLLLQRDYHPILQSLELTGGDGLPYFDWYREQLQDHIRQEQIKEFQTRFAESELVSIDRFLAINPEFDDAGRFMIALILLNCERQNYLKGNWYQTLFNELTTDGAEIPRDLVSVITFNYDRSLEWYLFRSFRATFNLNDSEAWKRVQQIKIVHVYGDLGPLQAEQTETVDFGVWKRAAASKKHIKLIQPRAQSKFIEQIKGLLTAPIRVVFLGFGFDSMNLDAIDMNENRGYSIYASCYDLSATRMEYAQKKLKKINWGSRSADVSRFLHDSVALS